MLKTSFLFFALTLQTFAQTLPDLIPYRKGDKWGYCDKNKQIMIAPLYDDVWENKQFNAVAVKTNNQWKMLDKTGKMLTNINYEGFSGWKENLGIVVQQNLFGLIDHTGKEILKPQYQTIVGFREGLSAMKKNELWGFIDKTGKEVIECKYIFVYGFINGIAKVYLKNGISFYIDRNGTEYYEP